MKTHHILRSVAVLIAGGLLLTGCERPPPESVQLGYRGVGQELVANPRTLAATVAANAVAAATAAAAVAAAFWSAKFK